MRRPSDRRSRSGASSASAPNAGTAPKAPASAPNGTAPKAPPTSASAPKAPPTSAPNGTAPKAPASSAPNGTTPSTAPSADPNAPNAGSADPPPNAGQDYRLESGVKVGNQFCSVNADQKVLIIYTGGTIGMANTAHGYEPVAGLLPQLMTRYPAFQDPNKPPGTMQRSIYGFQTTYKIKEYDPPLDSSQMDQRHWERIAGDIVANYDDFDGFVVLHGTDTLAFTASALSFMLEDLAKPVVVTGSQIPLVEQRSDAQENLLGALVIAGHFAIPEVTVFFRSQLMRGNRSWKHGSGDLNAFWSENLKPLAVFGINLEVAWDTVRPMPSGRCRLQGTVCPNVVVVRMYPGMPASLLKHMLAPPVQGAIVETFGAGNCPNDEEKLAVFREASARGVVLVNLTQCRSGGVSQGAYAAGSALAQCGFVAAGDMTMEAALTKLMCLLGTQDAETTRTYMVKNMRGELTQKTEKEPIQLGSDHFIKAICHAMGTEAEEMQTQVREMLFPVLLCSAAALGDTAQIRDLCRRGTSPNAADYDLRTPLHVAAADKQLAVCSVLVSLKADVNVRDRWGATPLDEAAASGSTEVTRYLLSRDAALTSHDKIFSLVSARDLDAIRVFVEARGNVNTADYDRRTPLMVAAGNGDAELCALLLESGADGSLRDRWEKTAADGADKGALEVLTRVRKPAGRAPISPSGRGG